MSAAEMLETRLLLELAVGLWTSATWEKPFVLIEQAAAELSDEEIDDD